MRENETRVLQNSGIPRVTLDVTMVACTGTASIVLYTTRSEVVPSVTPLQAYPDEVVGQSTQESSVLACTATPSQ